MKKVLFASTALVAFGLAGAAQAADPIKLQLGGYSAWVFGYADNDATVGGVDYQDFDVKGTNEVFFKGSTTLDNGLKVGVMIELEAGGQTETRGTDTIDEAYVTVEGGFGRVVLGSEDPASYLLHVNAPVAAGQFYGEGEVGDRMWIGGTVGGNYMTTALGNLNGRGTDDSEKIIYFTPQFGGFTAGISYTPNYDPNGDDPNATLEGAFNDIIHIGAAYNNSFNGVGVKLSAGYATALDEDGLNEFDGWSLGGQFGFAGFTVGGSFKDINLKGATGAKTGLDGQVWDAGIAYATGPITVSFTYQASETDSDLEKDTLLFSGKYNVGPGVDFIAGIGHVNFDNAAGNVNDGWWAATGVALAF